MFIAPSIHAKIFRPLALWIKISFIFGGHLHALHAEPAELERMNRSVFPAAAHHFPLNFLSLKARDAFTYKHFPALQTSIVRIKLPKRRMKTGLFITDKQELFRLKINKQQRLENPSFQGRRPRDRRTSARVPQATLGRSRMRNLLQPPDRRRLRMCFRHVFLLRYFNQGRRATRPYPTFPDVASGVLTLEEPA